MHIFVVAKRVTRAYMAVNDFVRGCKQSTRINQLIRQFKGFYMQKNIFAEITVSKFCEKKVFVHEN